jgi:hypothetical protein
MLEKTINLKLIAGLFIGIFFISTKSEAQTPVENYVTALKSWQRKYCVSSHLGNLSVPIKEKIGEKFKINPSKIDFKRFNLSFDECLITVYTDKGPLTCQFLFDKEGNGVINPCPFKENIGSEYANQRFNNIGISWGMSRAIEDIGNGNTKFKDPFEGTGRGKSLF